MIYTSLLADLGTGGAERVSILMARVLKHHGHTVKFVCLCGGEDEISQWIRPEFELEILGARRTLTALPSLKNYLRSHRDTILFSSCEYVPLLIYGPQIPAGKDFGTVDGFCCIAQTIAHMLHVGDMKNGKDLFAE